MSDTELLRRFVSDHDHGAFAEVVRRQLDFVYAAARRHVNGDIHAAEDVAQQVFIDLALKAQSLVEHPCLEGWLYACTRFTAVNMIRREQRRSAREKEATLMDLHSAATTDWDSIRPVIDDALQELEERDRQFVLVRYFGRQSFGTIAQQFSVTENAAQKAVGRSLDLLNATLARRGITSTATALALMLSQSGVGAAPVTLLAVVQKAVAATIPATSIAAGTMAALKLSVTLAAVASAGLAAGYWTGIRRQIEIDSGDARALDVHVAAQIQRLEQLVRSETNRADAADTDTASLLRAIERDRAERTAAKPAVAATPTNRPSSGTAYAVQPRDTFPKIASAYGITVAELRVANSNIDAARLRVGQLITLPPGAKLAEPQSVTGANPTIAADQYVLKQGDTASKVAAVNGITLERLLSLNADVNWSRLIVGHPIRLK